MAATEHYIFNCPIRGKIDCGTGKVGSDLRAALSREGGETEERRRLIDEVLAKQHKADDPPHVDAPPTQPEPVDDVVARQVAEHAEYAAKHVNAPAPAPKPTPSIVPDSKPAQSIRDAASDLLQRGWQVMRLAPGTKKPFSYNKGSGAHDRDTITLDNLDAVQDGDGLAIRFSESGELKDVDFDYEVAGDLAHAVGLDKATAAFGHGGHVTHALYNALGAASIKLDLPEGTYPKPLPQHNGEPSRTVLEIRGGSSNTYSMCPPSVHPNGERLEWIGDRREPATVGADELRAHCGWHALASVALYFWPKDAPARYECRMALSAALVASGMPADKVATYVQAVAKLAGDPKSHEDFAERANERIEDGKPTTGIPSLVKILQLPESCIRTIQGWLQTANVNDGRQTVLIKHNTLNTNIENIESALIEANADIYQRGGQLVETYRLAEKVTDEAGVTRHQGAIGIHGVEAYRLLQIMDTNIRFTTMTKTGPITIPPPNDMAPHVAAHIKEWGFRPLNGIVEAPTLRADGTILQVAGYDPISGLLFDAGGATFPTIPENPQRADAIVALKVCTDLLAEYPFVLDDETAPHGAHDKPCASRSAALSTMITALVRREMDRAPVEGIDANSISSGKSHLSDEISIIATGREAAVMTLPQNDEEAAKVILSVLMNGDPVMVIDNVMPSQAVGGAVLSSIVTQSAFKGRVLGVSKMVEAPTNVTIIINGNNLVFAADMSSRAIKSRLNAGLENPDTRKFSRDLHAYTKEHRGEIICAILTILRAYIVANRPAPNPPSRFPQWDGLARGALVWLGEPDPQLTRVAIDDVDPERTDLGGLLEAFAACFNDKPVTAKQICDLINGPAAGDTGRALQAALAGLTKDGHVTTRQVTYIIRQRSEKIVGGRQFRCRADGSHVVHMRVETVKMAVTPELALS